MNPFRPSQAPHRHSRESGNPVRKTDFPWLALPKPLDSRLRGNDGGGGGGNDCVGIFRRLRGNDGRGLWNTGIAIFRRLLTLAALILFIPATQANEAAPIGEDPAIEQRMVKLAEDLRCLVCQNESLAGSHAELAEDLRREIREQMKAGKDDKQVITYLTERYGDFVLYRPPFKPVTWLLWLGPLLFLGLGGAIWYATLKKRRAMADTPVDSKQLATAAQLLDENK